MRKALNFNNWTKAWRARSQKQLAGGQAVTREAKNRFQIIKFYNLQTYLTLQVLFRNKFDRKCENLFLLVVGKLLEIFLINLNKTL